ncbi:hypothetical protein HYH02_010658 [Chlamydomonas schloesseri]|uniref:Uncharacterized protein n=1 Tax=Chlamydomonas schloesseri TaxID=2026947 RepID=A0A835W8J0_9CHLO|nr:hypothetical protein HYH02_010658 [Chlamydomonas schloesseri]|eukprot:KAG2439781.1 hypothetical protein HYH02_010658 [Chlamydomonas schloesseri]
MDEVDIRMFRFTAAQLDTFRGLASAMRNCSTALVSLAVGNVFVNALEAVEHHHSHHHHEAEGAVASAVEGAAAAGAAAVAAAGEAVAAAGEAVAAGGHAAAGHAGSAALTAPLFLEELVRAVSLSDVAFCVNALIPAALIAYSVGPFAQLAKGPDEPHMGLALKGVGRLSLTMQQLAWTSGSVGVVLLLEAAVKYPPMVSVASGACLGLAVARGAALWWVVSRHTTSGEEVARTLAALRGQAAGQELHPLDRLASWLALGALLQAEPSIHSHGHGHDHHHRMPWQKKPEEQEGAGEGHGHKTALASVTAPHPEEAGLLLHVAPPGSKPHYEFDLEEERVLRSLVEASNAAGLAILLQVLALLSLGIAEAATSNTPGLVSHTINATQKAANAAVLFASSAAFDNALHNKDGNDDTDHLLSGLGRDHAGMTGLFTSMAVLSWALLMAGGVALLVPALEESPLGVLVGDGVLHMSADVLVEVLEAI